MSEHVEHFTLNDALQSSKPLQIDSNQIKTLLANNQHYITWVKTYLKKILIKTHQLGNVSHFDGWHPYKLRETISMCNLEFTCNENQLFSVMKIKYFTTIWGTKVH